MVVFSFIKSKRVFKKVFEDGRFIKGKNISLKYISGGSDKIEFGMVVPQKKIPLAVNRNLIRRRIKFLIRQKSFIDKKRIPIGFYLLIYSARTVLPYEKIKDSVLLAFSRVYRDT